MKTLTVQIQEGLATALEAEDAVRQLLSLAGDKLPEGRAMAVPGEGCINVNFRTLDLPRLWLAIQESLGFAEDARPPIARALVVVCEGEYGWDDYLLLHHYDDYEVPDIFPFSNESGQG
jgi:hypothetical protein